LFGHDWRRAIDPREGYYQRCRRCWMAREVEPPDAAKQPGAANEPWRREPL
jgi:hypothetical protein